MPTGSVLVTIVLGLVVAWLVLLVRAWRAASAGGPLNGRLNGWMAFATVVVGFATCGAPVGSLITWFGSVAEAPPSAKADVLARGIEESQVWLAWLAVPVFVAGLAVFVRNRRRAVARRSP